MRGYFSQQLVKVLPPRAGIKIRGKRLPSAECRRTQRNGKTKCGSHADHSIDAAASATLVPKSLPLDVRRIRPVRLLRRRELHSRNFDFRLLLVPAGRNLCELHTKTGGCAWCNRIVRDRLRVLVARIL